MCSDRSPKVDGRRVAVEVDPRLGQRPQFLGSGTSEQGNDDVGIMVGLSPAALGSLSACSRVKDLDGG